MAIPRSSRVSALNRGVKNVGCCGAKLKCLTVSKVTKLNYSKHLGGTSDVGLFRHPRQQFFVGCEAVNRAKSPRKVRVGE
ncbi:hypothetical protein NXC14_PA00143 (plasmid) [Rhizobium sp. NXC14]|nr:hypothetical protein NXC14_PA00143 [Rhizobium sp. NXC14]